MVSYMFKFAALNNFTHKHTPFGNYWMTEDMQTERTFLMRHYGYPKKPFSTDQHIVFVNAVEDYGFEEHERPNWINVVRPPIERLVSLFYHFKNQKTKGNPNQILSKFLSDLTGFTGKSQSQIKNELKGKPIKTASTSVNKKEMEKGRNILVSKNISN